MKKIRADEDPGLRIESFAVINLRGVSTNKTIICFIAMQTYKELNFQYVEKTSAECNENSYLAILHLSRVELHCKLQEKLHRVTWPKGIYINSQNKLTL